MRANCGANEADTRRVERERKTREKKFKRAKDETSQVKSAQKEGSEFTQHSIRFKLQQN